MPTSDATATTTDHPIILGATIGAIAVVILISSIIILVSIVCVWKRKQNYNVHNTKNLKDSKPSSASDEKVEMNQF